MGRRVYGHIERLYRLCSFYDGKRQPLEGRARLCDRDFEKIFRADHSAPSHLVFDLTYTGVEVNGAEVFVPPRLESSFCYLLMVEGIKSVVVMNQVTATELLDWCLDVQNYLKNGSSDEDDLAFFLWKGNYANIRVRLYSALTGSEAPTAIATEGADRGTQISTMTDGALVTGGAVVSDWHKRDKIWQLPEGQYQANRLSISLNDWESISLKGVKQQLSDAAYHEGASRIIGFEQAELIQVQEELDSFDQAHVDFNLLNQDLEVLKSNALPPSTSEFTLSQLRRLIDDIVKLFQPALLTFLLKKLNEKWAESAKALRDHFSEKLTKSLEGERHQSALAQALCQRERAPRAMELIALIRPELWEKFFFFLSTYRQPEATAKFFQVLLRRGAKLGDLLFKWGSHAVELGLEAIPFFEWPDRAQFLRRCLHHSDPSVVSLALRELPRVTLSERDFKKAFLALSPELQEEALKGLLRSNLSESWMKVIRNLTEAGWMFEFSEPVFLSWMELTRSRLGHVVWKKFLPLLQERTFGFVPKYPKERKLLLLFAAEVSDPQMPAELCKIFREEAQNLLQSSDLRRKLKEKYS